MDGVARPLADRLAELRLDGQPVRAVPLRHERAVERFAVDRAAALDEPARVPKRSAASSITTHVHAPGLSPFWSRASNARNMTLRLSHATELIAGQTTTSSRLSPNSPCS